MRRYAKAITVIFMSMFLLFNCGASFFKRSLRTERVKPAAIKGVFTVILYGGSYSDDLETIAVLDIEGDEYEFAPYAPDYSYKKKKGVPASEAVKTAEEFVKGHRNFYSHDYSRILDPKGGIIGYEIRPLYDSLTYGTSDVLDVDYSIKGNKVIVRVKKSSLLEKSPFEDLKGPFNRK